MSCRSIFADSISVTINVHYGLKDAELSQMVSDAHAAISFSKKYFKLPTEIAFNASPRNDFSNVPHYDESTDRINYTFQFGKIENGTFISKSRRHSQDIFNHEFGHLIFRHNMGSTSEIIRFYRDNYIKKAKKGLNPIYLSDEVLNHYISAYNELFADTFAVAISGNPRAMYSGEAFIHKESTLSGRFHASPKEVIRARDFLNKMDVETWKESEVHIALAPSRSAFANHPYAIYLFKNDPQRLVKVAFNAIQHELKTLFSDDLVLIQNLSVPDLNKRMIKTMLHFLEKDQEMNP